ncbi:MAG: hypothetical protein AAGE05_12885 [Pseudomonadota bacterium]
MSDTLLFVLLAIVALIVVLILLRSLGKRNEGADIEPGDVEIERSFEAPLAISEEPVPAADPQPAESGPADPLTQIKGLGPKAEVKLNGIGMERFEQIAAWTAGDIAAIDAQFGLGDRIERDRWVEQAGFLAQGDIAGFEAKFGKLG